MLKLTKTAVGLLTKQYRSVLRKCLLLNLGLFTATAVLATFSFNIAKAVDIGSYAYSDATGYYNGWYTTKAIPSRNKVGLYVTSNLYQTISTSNSIIQNLEALDAIIGSLVVSNGAQATGNVSLSNFDFTNIQKTNQAYTATVNGEESVFVNLTLLDYVVGRLPSGTYVSNVQSMGDNVKALDTAIGAKIASNGHYIKKSDTNSITANLSALDYALYNYYYTKTEADARYAKLSGGNTFTGTQVLRSSKNGSVAISLFSDGNSGEISLFNEQDKNYKIISLSSISGSGTLKLEDVRGGNKTILSNSSFILNGSSSATGIDFATNVTAGTTNASHLATTGAVNQLLNYYYTFRVDETVESAEFALFLNNAKLSSVFEA